MTQTAFKILTKLERAHDGLSARHVAMFPIEELTALNDAGYVRFYAGKRLITRAGLSALEPYMVRRAVILAAGYGSRLLPITESTPKPMIKINGVRIIDTILDALTAAGIGEIHIIRGHLGNVLDELTEKYPGIQMTDNPRYDSANNLYSALCAKDWLQNAYVFDADLYIKNPCIVRKYEYRTNYLAVRSGQTDEWLLNTAQDGVTIDRLSFGGSGGYRMFSLSYWDAEDGKRLAEDILRVSQTPKGHTLFWDEVPLRCCKENYRIALRCCENSDILEFDTLEELATEDPAYNKYLKAE